MIYNYITENIKGLLEGNKSQAVLKPLLCINHFQDYENSSLVELNSHFNEPLNNSSVTVVPDDDLGLDMERAF